LLSSGSYFDNASFDITWEVTGSNTDFDFTQDTTPTSAISTFLNDLNLGQQVTLSAYLSPIFSRGTNDVTIEYYDVTDVLDGSPAGSPVRTDQITLEHAAYQPSTEQAANATCIGFRAAYGSLLEKEGTERPRSRERGRFYLPALNAGWIDDSTGQWGSTYYPDVCYAAIPLLSTQASGEDYQFNAVVWSRKNAAVVTPAFYYVDDAPAVIRKREKTTLNRVHQWVALA
jgi:hypothetical protein